MATWSDEEEMELQELMATLTAMPKAQDDTAVFLDILQKYQESVELDAELEEQEKELESLKERIKEQKEEKLKLEAEERALYKEEDAKDPKEVEKAEREWEEILQKREEESRLTEEAGMLVKEKEELQRQIEEYAIYKEYMEQVVKLTKFKDVQQLAGYYESLLHLREQLLQKNRETDQQIKETREALSTLKNEHHLKHLQKMEELRELQTELTRTLAETREWEEKRNNIQETSTKERLELAEIKQAVLNLYEMTVGNEDEVEPEDKNDMEKQLERVKKFIQYTEELLRQHQAVPQRQKGRKGKKGKGQKGQRGQH